MDFPAFEDLLSRVLRLESGLADPRRLLSDRLELKNHSRDHGLNEQVVVMLQTSSTSVVDLTVQSDTPAWSVTTRQLTSGRCWEA